MKRRIIIISSIVLAVTLVAVIGFVVIPALNRHALDVQVDRSAYPVKGIDVSHHNGVIDYDRVRADSVDFVIIKATDGVGDTDRNLIHNYREAQRAGLDVGVYHYFRYHRSGVQQAQYFLSVVGRLDLDLPIAIDLEKTDNDAPDDHVVSRLRDMINLLKRHGYRVMIYANHDQYEEYIDGRFDDVDIWMASSRIPDADDPRRIWQHSHRGKVDGVEGDVDLNTFVGSRDDYQRWLDAKGSL